MGITMKRWGMALLCIMMSSLAVQAAPVAVQASPVATMLPLLQIEVNAVSQLNGQEAFLRQQGDSASATLLSCFEADHQQQESLLLAAAKRLNQTLPTVIMPTQAPYLGPLGAIFSADLQQETAAGTAYRQSLQSTDAFTRQIAQTGVNSTAAHLAALAVAISSLSNTPNNVLQGFTGALILERGLIANLQALAAQLQSLGDGTTANTLLNAVPAHQQFAAQLASAVTQAGGNPASATPIPLAPFISSQVSQQHLQTARAQLAATYAIAARGTGPLQAMGAQGLLLPR